VCVLAPPVFSTELKLLSLVSIPTGTLPVPQATQVPPNKELGFVLFTLKYIAPIG